MPDFLKRILAVLFVIVYMIAPDLVPGPIDDIVVAIVMGAIGSRNNTKCMEG